MLRHLSMGTIKSNACRKFFGFSFETRFLRSDLRKCLLHEGFCELHLNKLTSSHRGCRF